MRRIDISTPKHPDAFTLVDDGDFELLSQWKWHIVEDKWNVYACRTARPSHKHILMHRQIMCCPKGKLIDHVDHDGLNNQRSNLRICTSSQNQMNSKKQADRTSKFKGVTLRNKPTPWLAGCKKDGKRHNLGHFKTEIEAAKAYDKKAKELFGEFARLNFPSEGEKHE